MGISMYNKTTLDLDIAFNNDLLEPDGIVQVTDVLVGSSTVWRIRFEYSQGSVFVSTPRSASWAFAVRAISESK